MNVEGALGDAIIMEHNGEPIFNPVVNKGQKRTLGKRCITDTKKGDTFKFKTTDGTDNVSYITW